MTVLFAGGRLESVTVRSGSPADTTDSISGVQTWDNTWSDASLGGLNGTVRVGLYDAGMNETTLGPGHSFWFHGLFFVNGMHAYPPIVINDDAGNPFLRLLTTYNNNDLTLQFNSGTPGAPVWTALGQTINANNGMQRWDLQVQMPASGAYIASFYINENATTAEGSFTAGYDSGQPLVGSVDVTVPLDLYVSQILCTADQSTIGAHVATSRATGAGNYQQWTGGYTNVNEPLDNDSTADQATTAGLKQSYPMGNVTVPEGFAIASVFHWLRAKNDGASPDNIASVCITEGSEYETGNLPGIGAAYSAVGARYDTNPNTGQPWTQAEWNGPVQLGYQSEA